MILIVVWRNARWHSSDWVTSTKPIQWHHLRIPNETWYSPTSPRRRTWQFVSEMSGNFPASDIINQILLRLSAVLHSPASPDNLEKYFQKKILLRKCYFWSQFRVSGNKKPSIDFYMTRIPFCLWLLKSLYDLGRTFCGNSSSFISSKPSSEFLRSSF